jgi:hypothetical protein
MRGDCRQRAVNDRRIDRPLVIDSYLPHRPRQGCPDLGHARPTWPAPAARRHRRSPAGQLGRRRPAQRCQIARPVARPTDDSALGTATSAGLPEGRRAGDDRLVSVLQTPLCRLLGVLIPAVASRSASSQRQSAGPQRTILEPWCSAIHPTRLRTAFCYALMVLSAYPSARSASS